MKYLLVKGGRVIDPAAGTDEVRDIWIGDGKLVELDGLPAKHDTIDAKGCVVAPGFVDIHVHLREPGQEGKETISSGAKAALAGGFTSIACMANTVPVNDTAITTGWISTRAKESGVPVRVFPIGAVTKGLEGKELAELIGMRRAGAVAFSDDGMPVMSAGLYRRAMEIARELDAPVISHCEDLTITAGGAMHEGAVSTELGVPGVSWASEAVMVARDLVLAQATGARLHLAHLSTAESVRLVRDAKKRGVKVTAEASPHHLSLTDERVRGWDTSAKMNPPLRPKEHVDALLEGLADGTIDAIATDHAPHGSTDKDCEFGRAANGITGLETALPIVLAQVKAGRLTLPRAVELLTIGPAKALGLDAGTMKNGARADVVIFDPAAKWRWERPVSKSRNSPWLGQEMTGKVKTVIAAGEVWNGA
jgi:dihydroorotase